jgi:4-diphosphocytidyl-2-C-methyl-D-erythritol kinase
MGNDFEAAILPAFSAVADAHRAMKHAGALRALLCGSGSAVFGLAESAEHAEEMARELREANRFAWVEVAESLP